MRGCGIWESEISLIGYNPCDRRATASEPDGISCNNRPNTGTYQPVRMLCVSICDRTKQLSNYVMKRRTHNDTNTDKDRCVAPESPRSRSLRADWRRESAATDKCHRLRGAKLIERGNCP